MALRAVAKEPKPTARAPRAAARIPSSVDHLAAQAEMSPALFPDYLLGRQLALEETLRELLLAAPPEVRDAVRDKLRFSADLTMQRLNESRFVGDREESTLCGYVATLLQQGA